MENSLDKKFKILDGFPQSSEAIISFGNQPLYSEGFVVNFFKDDGSSWVGNFNPGFNDTQAVYPLNNKNNVIVIARGSIYIVNINEQTALVNFGMNYQILPNTSSNFFVLFNETDIAVISNKGDFWHSPRISWDGMKDLKEENGIVTGLAYDPTDRNQEWKHFSLNLKTHTLNGGSYIEF